MRLSEAVVGQKYTIVKIDYSDKNALKKICSLGILPGLEVEITQVSPMIIFSIFNSRFAIDDYLASKIILKNNGKINKNAVIIKRNQGRVQ